MPRKSSSNLQTDAPNPKSQNNRIANEKLETRDFHDVLESVAWLWRIFGVFPIATEASIGIKKYNITKFLGVYSSLVFGICVGNFLYVSINYDFYFNGGPFRVTSGTAIIRSFGNILCVVASTAYRLLKYYELSESINNIMVQGMILETTSRRSDCEFVVKIVRIYVWTTIFAVIFLILFEVYVVHRYDTIVSSTHTIWTISLLVQVISLTVFTTLVTLLGLNFRSLNRKIRIVVKRANASSPKVLVASNDWAERIRFMSKMHFNLCAVGKRLNRIFDIEVIISVTVAFVILSTTLYHIFYEVEKKGETNFAQILTHIYWELYHSIPIITIVAVCNFTSLQSVGAGELIHDIEVESTDSDLYRALKSFSLQLHHQKLEFTAGGFFPINSELLQTMAAKITTYLVILIQFQPKLN
ncbi:putative gustatory receptor 28b [Venturia canescens]|uniref:putative gustatory receptor 28b n=1 Tax=Venturia canescens TaxID=32260 RepID=UPI001C9BCFBD|nr:putative gustatory receptor 28b [Venturia canescens]